MRRVKMIVRDGVAVPDWPQGGNFPPDDPNIEGMLCNGEEYIIYETGDDLPESMRPRLHVLRSEWEDSLALWRYMDFARLYSLISKRAIHFTPGCVLQKNEPYELRVPIPLANESRRTWIEDYRKLFPGDDDGLIQYERMEKLGAETLLYGTGISCWHMNRHENNALWKVFLGNQLGVALKTSLGRLRRSIEYRRRYIVADAVEYIDYESDAFKPHPSAIGFEQLFHKSSFFEYEREFRLAYRLPLEVRQNLAADGSKNGAHALHAADPTSQIRLAPQESPFVPVDLAVLIEEIVVSPDAGSWFSDNVGQLLLSASLGDVPVRSSKVGHWPTR